MLKKQDEMILDDLPQNINEQVFASMLVYTIRIHFMDWIYVLNYVQQKRKHNFSKRLVNKYMNLAEWTKDLDYIK